MRDKRAWLPAKQTSVAVAFYIVKLGSHSHSAVHAQIARLATSTSVLWLPVPCVLCAQGSLHVCHELKTGWTAAEANGPNNVTNSSVTRRLLPFCALVAGLQSASDV